MSLRSMIMAASLGGLLTLSACGQNGPLVLPKRPPKPPDAMAPAVPAAAPAAGEAGTDDGRKRDATKR